MSGLGLRFTIGPEQFVPFHRTAHRERWKLLAGDPLELHLIHPDGEYEIRSLQTAATIEAGTLRAARLTPGGSRASCMREKAHPSASSDIVFPSAAEILREHPLHADVVRQFTLDGFD
jgi:predicted cupin superfamily sugar epimerase